MQALLETRTHARKWRHVNAWMYAAAVHADELRVLALHLVAVAAIDGHHHVCADREREEGSVVDWVWRAHDCQPNCILALYATTVADGCDAGGHLHSAVAGLSILCERTAITTMLASVHAPLQSSA